MFRFKPPVEPIVNKCPQRNSEKQGIYEIYALSFSFESNFDGPRDFSVIFEYFLKWVSALKFPLTATEEYAFKKVTSVESKNE